MKNNFMMSSNALLFLPVMFAFMYSQWLYFFFATGLLIFSPLYHLYKIKKPNSKLFYIFKKGDWIFAIGAFIYMYYYTYKHLPGIEQLFFYTLLSLVLIFFWLGYKRKDYNKWHPWFHIIAPIISSAILIFAR